MGNCYECRLKGTIKRCMDNFDDMFPDFSLNDEALNKKSVVRKAFLDGLNDIYKLNKEEKLNGK